MSAGALTRLGSTTEAVDLLDWLLAVIETNDVNPDQLAPLYTVEGQPGLHRLHQRSARLGQRHG